MKAMLLEKQAPVETRPLHLMELPDPEPSEGQVRIRISVCGVCRTDLHEAIGELPMHKSPVIVGHQIVGRIDRLGPGAGSRVREGQRVGLPWLHRTCGQCENCRKGLENLCENALFTGYDVDGGYAEYVVAPEDFVLPLPDDYPDEQAAPLLCAGIIGYRALKLAGAREAETLGLIGFGASAHIAVQVARHWGARVFVFSRTESHRRLALSLGAEWAGTIDEKPPAALEAAVMFAPAGKLVPPALRLLAPGGTLALAGIYMDEIPALDYEQDLFMERVLRSVTAATREDAREMLELAPQVPVRSEVTMFDLSEANEALLRLYRSELDGVGVLRIGNV